MDILAPLVLSLLVLSMILVIVIRTVGLIRQLALLLAPRVLVDFIHRRLLWRPLQKQYIPYLQSHSQLYRSLSGADQRSFEKRVRRFLDTHQFISRSGRGVEVSDERRLRIAAVATELTYGHPHIYFEYFSKILVYEDAYYSNITKKYHYGEVNTRGYIVLSWTNFLKGADDADDGLHLGFHEMAHALQLEDHLDITDYSFLNKKALGRLKLLAERLAASDDKGLFRSRAFVDRFEFFAVAIENLFERPAELKAAHPEIHQTLTELLRHDPLDYQLRAA